jgi:hypothetical protein
VEAVRLEQGCYEHNGCECGQAGRTEASCDRKVSAVEGWLQHPDVRECNDGVEPEFSVQIILNDASAFLDERTVAHEGRAEVDTPARWRGGREALNNSELGGSVGISWGCVDDALQPWRTCQE